MSASNFALPATRGYPIEDKKHAALAKSGASHAENIGNISRSTEQKIDRKADRVLSRGGHHNIKNPESHVAKLKGC